MALNHLIESYAFINHVLLSLNREIPVCGDVFSPCSFVNDDYYVIIFLLEYLLDVKSEMKAVPFCVGLDFT